MEQRFDNGAETAGREKRVFHVEHSCDVLVVGGGHAGCEAALASARMGLSTVLVTLDPTKIGVMSCNPCIGGVGKGQLVREIDALGGEMGKNADWTGIQFRRLNTRKGSAVQSSRCQSDKDRYAERMRGVVEMQPGLRVARGEIKSLIVENGRARGAILATEAGKHEIQAGAVVITAGTFMKAVMHCGSELTEGGRAGESGSVGLSDQLGSLGFSMMRLKTGTPPRLRADSIDFSALQVQAGDDPPRRFSFSRTEIPLPQVACHLTYTNEATHAVIAGNLHLSPLYSGRIQGIGPRYCPSIEDKVVKFPTRLRHQIFLEPETLDSDWIYPNGVSTSLPAEVQEAFIRTIPGCEKAQFHRFGYAVEYDCIDARGLTHALEARNIKGLFLAGQVNGTSGYEEAAAQGLLAGINASLLVMKRPPLMLSRSESYIGVLVDDLVSRGTSEPYRMFTSRAEFRLSLREDNADLRLRPYGIELGLVSEEDRARFEARKEAIASTKRFLSLFHVKQSASRGKFESWGLEAPDRSESLYKLLKRPELSLDQVLSLAPETQRPLLDAETAEAIEIEVKYEGYISIQQTEIERLKRLERTRIPESFDFRGLAGLSVEVQEKLGKIRPSTLAEAARVSGVTPAALAALLAGISKHKREPALVS